MNLPAVTRKYSPIAIKMQPKSFWIRTIHGPDLGRLVKRAVNVPRSMRIVPIPKANTKSRAMPKTMFCFVAT